MTLELHKMGMALLVSPLGIGLLDCRFPTDPRVADAELRSRIDQACQRAEDCAVLRQRVIARFNDCNSYREGTRCRELGTDLERIDSALQRLALVEEAKRDRQIEANRAEAAKLGAAIDAARKESARLEAVEREEARQEQEAERAAAAAAQRAEDARLDEMMDDPVYNGPVLSALICRSLVRTTDLNAAMAREKQIAARSGVQSLRDRREIGEAMQDEVDYRAVITAVLRRLKVAPVSCNSASYQKLVQCRREACFEEPLSGQVKLWKSGKFEKALNLPGHSEGDSL